MMGLRHHTEAGARRNPVVRQRLRLATAAIHQSLHEHPAFVRLLEGRMRLAEYRALIARLYGFHWPLDRGLRSASPQVLGGLDAGERERSPVLRADLRALGLADAEIDRLPLCDTLSPVRSYPALLGRLYVVEGAALGGRVLAAKLDGVLEGRGVEGRAFFLGRASPDPLPWPTFCELLEAQSAPTQIAAMTKSAETTFHAMGRWLANGEIHV
jgi:heme oxygenase (biliverdin-IX-beta and delta-forming)